MAFYSKYTSFYTLSATANFRNLTLINGSKKETRPATTGTPENYVQIKPNKVVRVDLLVPNTKKKADKPQLAVNKSMISHRGVSSTESFVSANLQTLSKDRPKTKTLNKTKLINKHCRYVHEYGRCKEEEKCAYIHDQARVGVCKRWLNGETCSLGKKCCLKHTPCPQVIPHCRHFQRGLCLKKGCRYTHVHVAKNALVCEFFAEEGYCPKGNTCKEKHERRSRTNNTEEEISRPQKRNRSEDEADLKKSKKSKPDADDIWNQENMSSRLIVKNLPSNLSDNRFRQHFAAKGEVTDAKIMRTTDGTSRRFGFIGYRNQKEAQEAMEYFNNTYVDTYKILIELAKPVNDPSLPRPWSAHSFGSAFCKQQNQDKNEGYSSNLKKVSQFNSNLQKQEYNDAKDTASNEKLKEYLEVMQPRTKSKTWGNDDTGYLTEDPADIEGKKVNREIKKGSKVGINKQEQIGVYVEGEFDEDEFYEDLPSLKNKGRQTETKEKNSTSKSQKKKIIQDKSKSQKSQNFITKSDDSSENDIESLGKKVSSISNLGGSKVQIKYENNSDDNNEPDTTQDYESSHENASSSDYIEEEENDEETQTLETVQDSKYSQNISTNEKPSKPQAKQHEVPPEETIADTGRLFVRNLPYICTEDDLRRVFNPFGPLAEVHMPIDRETKIPKGFAYILYLIPEHAVKAFIELDNQFFMGRLLHILPAWEKLDTNRKVGQSSLSLKEKKEMKQKSEAFNDFNWNTLYMSTDAIAESVAHRFNIKKSDILDPESDNMSTRLALAETHIIQETKSYLESQGLVLAAFSSKERSDTIILVKNILYNTTKEELNQLFGWYGDIGRLILPPSKTMAVVEFLHPTEARVAFASLAYKHFKGIPLYLEKAPAGLLISQSNEENSNNDIATTTKSLASSDFVEPSLEKEDMDLDAVETATLFVKNISFNTTEEELHTIFKNTPGMRSVKIKMKKDPKNPGAKLSMGFGFIEYDNMKNAKNALKSMQNYELDGHALQLKFSSHINNPMAKRLQEKQESKGKKASTKIIVKNLAFESTKKDLKELFGAFAQIKSLRVPKKFDGTSRGFAFIEFLTKRDAQNVMEHLSATHLLGRHLVLEYAEQEQNDVEMLREKVVRDFAFREAGSDGRAAKRKKVDLEEWTAQMGSNED
ncbi:hypothetical protein G9A89_023840 [Geosiphon pyriformis]|nr:hypothetical protein G9A89_023840 [Geosiphon pyriformis]